MKNFNLNIIKKSFLKDGFVKVNGIFEKNLVNTLLNSIENSENLKKADGVIFDDVNDKVMLRYIPQPQNSEPIFLKLISSKLLNIGSILLDEEIYFSGIDIHCRAAKAEKPTPPHQDSFLACFEDGYESLITCYVSLSGMDEGTACLRFIKGSHKKPTLNHKKSLIRGFSSVIEDSSDGLPKEMLENEEIITLEKGECVFFHSKTIHYTNQLEKPRSGRSSAAIRLGGFNARYSSERQAVYKNNVKYNRENTKNEGLTAGLSKPQHNN
ncbi:phytanoyl-CoA dioxygenase family protein [Amylibacter sp.]|nr:phytanoyl-CoA dioxygenase family protein [Amylibacter sp.]